MKKNIAIVGTGVSGLVTAWLLHKNHNITVYEKDGRVGGHANTQSVQCEQGIFSVDTGFMVFNKRTYPLFLSLVKYFNIDIYKTDMSFGIRIPDKNFEFTSDNIFVQKSNVFRPRFWKMIRDIVRFNRDAEKFLIQNKNIQTLGELIKSMELSDDFSCRYLLPMAGAIWSIEKNTMADYPAKNFIDFFKNHGLLSPKTLNPFRLDEDRLQWYTISGGSQSYVQKITQSYIDKILLHTAVVRVEKEDDKLVVTDNLGRKNEYDDVIFACHPDHAMHILSDRFSGFKTQLSKIHYSKHRTVLHKDKKFMLQKTRKWSSWTYVEPEPQKAELTYYMNRLQDIDKSCPIFVTLDPSSEIKKEDIFYETIYQHPIFTSETKRAQKEIRKTMGKGNVYFCGAWLGHGFHEDGVQSAVNVAEKFGVDTTFFQ